MTFLIKVGKYPDRLILWKPLAVEATRRPTIADPEFEPSPATPFQLRDFDPPEHQRLVVNPFLAVFVLAELGPLASWFFSISPLFSVLAVPVLLVLLPNLIHYHCLDCGRTGRYSRRAGHACPAVLSRWQEGRRSRGWFPSSWAQLVVWSWLLGSAALLIAVLWAR